jgi:hypothetical protein
VSSCWLSCCCLFRATSGLLRVVVRSSDPCPGTIAVIIRGAERTDSGSSIDLSYSALICLCFHAGGIERCRGHVHVQNSNDPCDKDQSRWLPGGDLCVFEVRVTKT